ncbi:MAG: twin-arginine translocation signal domain-containing protein, partial [Halobacteria archaeon]|nr:twin-arginine translocation signal domain-containing protein [Halobacteria archaeon]
MSKNESEKERKDAREIENENRITRRNFVKGIGVTGALGSLGLGVDDSVFEMSGLETVGDPIGNYPYREWEDLYRDEWSWDSVSRSTHSVNCTGSCSWNVYVKDGQVW